MYLEVLIPMAVVGTAFYFVISGLRESVKLVRLAVGYGIMLAAVLTAGVAASLSIYLALAAFILGVFAGIASLVGGVYCLGLLNGWRRVHAVSGILFPLMLFGSIFFAVQFAPDPLTLEEQYIQHTNDVLNDIQAPGGALSNDYWDDEGGCVPYLRERLSKYGEQYSLHAARVIDPAEVPIPIGSTEAAINVEFPDGSQVQLTFYNFTPLGCNVIDD